MFLHFINKVLIHRIVTSIILLRHATFLLKVRQVLGSLLRIKVGSSSGVLCLKVCYASRSNQTLAITVKKTTEKSR